ncbi:DUF4465 domain-containing protein [Dysgonomonas sp. 25]|uniref:DUF4465 domain-containing protein n=1 Tax=Dysgonomonas sp. 25 TaxID=2302933 RepID=UPI0013D16C32|nr:DUF4465 domain-containing protein [Dysgonomonas sp. 25]NDV69660.1 DUF4465 domain-containing protein [Dysgonomonas sp. 25]
MKKIYLLLLATLALGFTACSDDDDHHYVDLDMSTFNLSDGVAVTDGKYWKNTYIDGTNITSGIFAFSHSSAFANYFEGFTASNVANNSDHGSDWYPDNQFAAMPKGAVAGEGKPYLVSYGEGLTFGAAISAPYAGKTFSESSFSSWVKVGAAGDRYKAHRVSIANTSLTYYAIKNGNGTANAFDNGDYYRISIYGVDADMKITAPVTVYLADYRDGKTAILDKWQKVNISSLGEVRYIFFILESSDNSTVGGSTYMNTPAYFCLDRLVVDKVK